ncbi:hypothetical protein PVAP13_1KG363700 [Panicum virgatum]|uniref:Uncharacterized protein n=1 Tax=Panicum virgatum TaxID=38727 RepID=A0A8T0XIM2_PANVG|nr:hypothetical protein PVAP13_1KG363700 [Panicum virgatum]
MLSQLIRSRSRRRRTSSMRPRSGHSRAKAAIRSAGRGRRPIIPIQCFIAEAKWCSVVAVTSSGTGPRGEVRDKQLYRTRRDPSRILGSMLECIFLLPSPTF